MNRSQKAIVALVCLIILGCNNKHSAEQARSLFILIDTQGNYSDEFNRLQKAIIFALSRLKPGDSFALAYLEVGKSVKHFIKTKVTFDDRPSMAKQQKHIIKEQVAQLVGNSESAAETNLKNSLLQAADYLNQKTMKKKMIFIFSDLKGEPDKGQHTDDPLNLNDVDVVLMHLDSNKNHTTENLNKVENWRQLVENAEGTWSVAEDINMLSKLLL